ncbi:MAG: hypothetical protein QOK25_2863 [Thermoleophilaceae bacterium]|jgi:hypothetical protein|nr:hypothetical protein [Thermoleophilaceae bacterium]
MGSRTCLSMLAAAALVVAGAGCGTAGSDPPSIARLGSVGISHVSPARVAPRAGSPPVRSLLVQVALNTVYPTRDASRASIYRRFHWVELDLSGRRAAARRTSGYNDDRSHSTDGGYQNASAWIDQYLVQFDPAPRLPARGQVQTIVTACDQDPRTAHGTFCQRRALPLCLRRGVVVGQPAESDGFPHHPGLNSCRTPSFDGRYQSAGNDGLYFRSLGD